MTISDVERTFWQFVGLGGQPYILAGYIYSQSAILKTKSYKIMCFFFVIFNSHNSIKKRKSPYLLPYMVHVDSQIYRRIFFKILLS